MSPANLCAYMTKAKTVYLVDPEPPEFGVILGGRMSSYSNRESQMELHPDCRVVQETAVIGVRKVVDELLS